MVANTTRLISLGRHERNCRICAHKCREEIERAFINWTSPNAIAKSFGISDRATIYRHAHAVGLFSKRQRNVRAALEKIIERAGEVEVTSGSVVAAVQAYARINSQGEWVGDTERVGLGDLFARMSREELDAYAKYGSLPFWFEKALGATAPRSLENGNHEESTR
jgi:hypothetical protein